MIILGHGSNSDGMWFDIQVNVGGAIVLQNLERVLKLPQRPTVESDGAEVGVILMKLITMNQANQAATRRGVDRAAEEMSDVL